MATRTVTPLDVDKAALAFERASSVLNALAAAANSDGPLELTKLQLLSVVQTAQHHLSEAEQAVLGSAQVET
jgi:hypothetical protein